MTDRRFEGISDETVVVNHSSDAFEDRTVVVNHQPNEVEDQTVVVSHPVSEVEDQTVVVSHPVSEVSDHTVVAPPASVNDAAKIAVKPAEGRSLRKAIGGGLDPQRPIAEAPGALPWEVQPTGERGVAQGLPVSYGARVNTRMPLVTGNDEVRRLVGPAPEARHVQIVAGREALPSLRQRDRKRGVATLVAYAGVVVACAIGLYGVATVAFGW